MNLGEFGSSRGFKTATFDPDKALVIARRSVHAFFSDKRYELPVIRLKTVKDEEIEDLIKNNPY